jgi:hypothetical protein
MEKNLFTTFYTDINEVRNKELLFCMDKNLSQPFHKIVLLLESDADMQDFVSLFGHDDRVYLKVVGKRPTFNDFFKVMDEAIFSEGINILCNSDIFFLDIDINLPDEKTCYALSRWDYVNDNDFSHFCRADSQDTWIFKGNHNFRLKEELDFTMGVAGCDNRLAYELKEAGFNVLNPSKSIKTFHYHNSQIRNYIQNGEVIQRVPPPYYLVEPY